MGGELHIALKRQLGVPPNLYNADLYYFMGNSDIRINEPLQCARNESSDTLKGAAVKVVQHTQLPFGEIAIE